MLTVTCCHSKVLGLENGHVLNSAKRKVQGPRIALAMVPAFNIGPYFVQGTYIYVACQVSGFTVRISKTHGVDFGVCWWPA